MNSSPKGNSGMGSSANAVIRRQQDRMKRTLSPMLMVVLATTFLTGCAWQIGGDKKSMEPTTGQQLIDLQKAKDSGAITDSEYQAQKAKLLHSK
jgi:hypothetical protein